MKKVFFISLALSFAIALHAKAETKSPKNQILFCLSSLYTSEKSYFEENEVYSENMEEIGFNEKDSCRNVKLKIYSPIRDQFIAYAKLENQTWSIDDKKHLENLNSKKINKKKN